MKTIDITSGNGSKDKELQRIDYMRLVSIGPFKGVHFCDKSMAQYKVVSNDYYGSLNERLDEIGEEIEQMLLSDEERGAV